jgi:hypothetical protein
MELRDDFGTSIAPRHNLRTTKRLQAAIHKGKERTEEVLGEKREERRKRKGDRKDDQTRFLACGREEEGCD